MKSKLNNKGYMLIEIILASALAFGLAYFIIDLTIKLKNKNDDLMITTLMSTDQAIISNKLMEYIKSENDNFDCDSISVDEENNTILYNEKLITQINEYSKISYNPIENCFSNNNYININIPISVPQIPNGNFDVDVYYEFSQKKQMSCSDIISSYSCNGVPVGNAPAFTYTGNCEVIDESNGNCKIRFLTSGDLTLKSDFIGDLFLVGGGGGGSRGGPSAFGGTGAAESYGGGGGGGGYTFTSFNQTIYRGTYKIQVGLGGTSNVNGGETYFDKSKKYLAKGGNAGSGNAGGKGGSGGGGGGGWTCVSFDWNTGVCNATASRGGGSGGSYGKNGAVGSPTDWNHWGGGAKIGGTGGIGQGTTTCEFGLGTTSGCNKGVSAYSAGGSGGATGSTGSAGGNNTGKGGGGGANSTNGAKGGSGIVIIRNAR